jgi:hypothetical protein
MKNLIKMQGINSVKTLVWRFTSVINKYSWVTNLYYKLGNTWRKRRDGNIKKNHCFKWHLLLVIWIWMSRNKQTLMNLDIPNRIGQEYVYTWSKWTLNFLSYEMKNQQMSLFQFYSYIDGSLHVSGLQAHPQENSHNHWFSGCTVRAACRARGPNGTATEPMLVWILLRMGL